MDGWKSSRLACMHHRNTVKIFKVTFISCLSYKAVLSQTHFLIEVQISQGDVPYAWQHHTNTTAIFTGTWEGWPATPLSHWSISHQRRSTTGWTAERCRFCSGFNYQKWLKQEIVPRKNVNTQCQLWGQNHNSSRKKAKYRSKKQIIITINNWIEVSKIFIYILCLPVDFDIKI